MMEIHKFPEDIKNYILIIYVIKSLILNVVSIVKILNILNILIIIIIIKTS